MRENRSYGSVGERGGNEPLYPDANVRLHIYIFLPYFPQS